LQTFHIIHHHFKTFLYLYINSFFYLNIRKIINYYTVLYHYLTKIQKLEKQNRGERGDWSVRLKSRLSLSLCGDRSGAQLVVPKRPRLGVWLRSSPTASWRMQRWLRPDRDRTAT
jgi:hypothetical protein